MRHVDIKVWTRNTFPVTDEIDGRLGRILTGYCPSMSVNRLIQHNPYV